MSSSDLYNKLYSDLITDTALIAFRKKDGSTRVMLCTRNISTICSVCDLNDIEARRSLAVKDSNKNKENGYLSVFDLEACDSRLVNTNTILDYRNLGVLSSGDADKVFSWLISLRDRYKIDDDILSD